MRSPPVARTSEWEAGGAAMRWNAEAFETHAADARRPPADVPRSAYIHVPFCGHRCGYCDFTLVARRDDLIEPYLEALERDLHALGAARPVDTLFFGGGTPTRLAAPQLTKLAQIVRRAFPLRPRAEFSVEANPSGLEDARIEALAEAGVNRVSLGVQSFDDQTLKFLERDHRAAEVERVVERLHSRFSSVAVDLIFGVPGQTLEGWRKTLRRALALGPHHVSTYGLTFEKGTTFWSRRNKRQIASAPEELEREMYAAAMDELDAAGIRQYELSNFARPGHECRHNQVYWSRGSHFGHGPGAVRMIAGVREMNHRSVTTWIRRVLAGESPLADSETLSPEAAAREAVVLGLRRAVGIHRAELRERFGRDLDALCGEAIARHRRLGLLEDTGEAIRLTREGRFVADSVMVDFV